jgi:hypothetical protein
VHGKVDEIAQAQLARAQGAAPLRDALDEHGHAAEARLDGRPRCLDPLGQRNLVLAREQLRAAHLTEVGIDQVARETRFAARSRTGGAAGLIRRVVRVGRVGVRGLRLGAEQVGQGVVGLERGGRTLLPNLPVDFPIHRITSPLHVRQSPPPNAGL